ncbi:MULTISPECIES: sensor histidine kinase [unclassified Streptomyces]|uniref:sensor histidine kinase n=1 Tax=unclassified Streptomyces TaxID=2593676 RepID=UPI002E78956A|nr:MULTISPECIES: HAMP domain-containing sensor histidine kinase [unclassified Streptomyces]MEE1763345.1 HAMP domain-containing sensor histidine kinase [Streptomyces sp. SP18BB07]MEE1831881.1 HAMP domain-containing sensor histidine kinase [Streptomyces sp. SP17KL33]
MKTTLRNRVRTLTVVRSVRVRVLASILLLTALGMTLTGVAIYVVQKSRIDHRVRLHVNREATEFELFHATAVDPETGKPFASLERLLLTATRRNVPDEHEALLSLIDGAVRYSTPESKAGLLSADRAFLRTVHTVIDGERPALRVVDTTAGRVQLAVRPVTRQGRTGAWVIAHWTEREAAEFADVMRAYIVTALGVLLLAALVGWFVTGRLLAPITVMRRTALRITDTDLTQRIRVSGNDDLSELGRTFNVMLGRLEKAFTDQRHFLDDVGHELRTPITVVRGHLELVDSREPAEVDEVRTLVIDELNRMARMVDDLLLLARAEQPDFLRLAAVDVGSLIDEVCDKARALGDRRWRVDARAETELRGDHQRLTQALLELAHNAVTLTGENDTVALGSAVDEADGSVRLWVRDTGPGVTPDDAACIFGRHQRGASCRRGGSGLGLSIVRAITEAHGGRVVLDSHPWRGATFTLVIPRDLAARHSGLPTRAPVR